MKAFNYKSIMFIILVITINFMKVIEINGASFNMALSDVLLPLVLMFLFLNSWRDKTMEAFYLWQWGLILIGWIILTGFIGLKNPEIINGGFKGILVELIKTMISLGYFYLGYNTLRYINGKRLKRLWIFNSITFVVFGLIWMRLVYYPMFTKFIDVKYNFFFMGTYTDPNHAATFLGINALIFFNWSIKEKGKFLKIAYTVLGIILSGLILLTDSRGGLLSFLLAFLCLFIVNWKLIINYIVEIIMGIVCSFFAIFFIDHKVLKGDLVSNIYYSFVNFDNGLGIRQSLSSTAFKMALEHPIFGVGRGNYVLNSKLYFDALGLKYIETIPHNTYIGLFAETGIIGLFLFLFPMLMLIFNVYKKSLNINLKKNMLDLLIYGVPIGVVIGLQAYILNVENQRLLWFILGIAMFYIKQYQKDSEIPLMNEKNQASNRRGKLYKYILYGLIVFLVVFFGKDHAYIRLRQQTISESYQVIIPTSKYSLNENYEVAYRIMIRQADLNQHSVEAELIEVHNNGLTDILEKRTYTPVSGVTKMNVTKKDPNSTLKLIFKNINPELKEFYVTPLYIKSEDQFRYLDRVYVLSFEKFLDTPFYRLGNNKEDDREDGLISYLDYPFDRSFKINTIKCDGDEKKYILCFQLKVLEDIPYETFFWFYGIPNDVSVLSREQMPLGFKYMTALSPVKYEKLYKGQILSFSYEIPKDSEYELRFGGYKIIDDKNVHFRDFNTKMQYLKLGKTYLSD